MKKQKLKLEDLKVQSFVTSMEEQEKQMIDGGAGDCFPTNPPTLQVIACPTQICPPTGWLKGACEPAVI